MTTPHTIKSLLLEINELSTNGAYKLINTFPDEEIFQINFNGSLWIRTIHDIALIALQYQLDLLKSASAVKVKAAIACTQYAIQHLGHHLSDAIEIAKDSYILSVKETIELECYDYNFHWNIIGSLADGTTDYILPYFGSLSEVVEYATKHFIDYKFGSPSEVLEYATKRNKDNTLIINTNVYDSEFD
jgi:hypothetical protein